MSIEAALNDFTSLIRGRARTLATSGDAAGLRLATATGLLLRGLELLDAARACSGVERLDAARGHRGTILPAAELLMRSAVEVAHRGRYLVVGEDADDEFARMLHDHQDRGEKLQKALKAEDPSSYGDLDFKGMAPWVLRVVEPSPERMRDAFTIAQALDKVSGRDAGDLRSAIFAYRRYFQWLSNSATHAGISAIGRFVEQAGSGFVDPLPEGLSSPGRRWELLIAVQLLELASVVWTAHGLPTEELERTGVHW